MYALLRRCLWTLPPEFAHDLALDTLGAAERLRLLHTFYPPLVSAPQQVMGLNFPNPVGLAAGLDKNADYYNALGHLGFGFIEVGTVTPLPQPGNPPPRLFRLPQHQAIINRMGFNNKGLDHLVNNLKRRRFRGVLGVNIGKNKQTPQAQALDDYVTCMQAVYPYADYITLNISSPNTPGLRDLQYGKPLDQLLAGIKRTQSQLADRHGRHVPVAVKIAPDMSEKETFACADTLMAHAIEGVIATNTTVARDGLESSPQREQTGGLSGAPLQAKSTEMIRRLAFKFDGRIPIIGVGGINSADDAQQKIEAGATLVQCYSGLIYHGPALVRQCVAALGKTGLDA